MPTDTATSTPTQPSSEDQGFSIESLGDGSVPYEESMSTVNSMLEGFLERLPYLIIALVIFLVFYFLSKVFIKILNKIIDQNKSHKKNLFMVFRRVGSALIIFFGFMIAMVVAIPGFSAGELISALGIGSVAIGFAFKDIFQNLISGILILISEPFKIGDQIITDGYEGTVEKIEIRATYIRTYDSRRVVIPNSLLYTSPVEVNTAYARRRLEVMVGIGYGDDIATTTQTLKDCLAQCETVSKVNEPLIVASEFGDSSINIQVCWYVEKGTQAIKMKSIHEVVQEIKIAFDTAGINIPFPIRTLDFGDESTKQAIQQLNATTS